MEEEDEEEEGRKRGRKEEKTSNISDRDIKHVSVFGLTLFQTYYYKRWMRQGTDTGYM
jgi:hypothetical protein